MPLAAGTRLGPYEIVSAIGKGGMGEVYKGVDTRLHREVAIKISVERFSERFGREARAIAALNHPNICTLYDVGPNYIVMEFVDGEAIHTRLKSGPIPLEESIAIARQIASALECAHEKLITHRDLKPGNVMLKHDGVVKVLDFGLAKFGSSGPTPVGEDSPTLTMGATVAGTILGTAAYMAPEQAKGKPVDKRADIWAFGVLLHEMVSGRQLFKGEDLTDTIAAVVMREPDLSDVPARIRPVLERCLVKDPAKRLRDISGVDLLLEEKNGAASPPHKASIVPWVAAAILSVLLAAAGWGMWWWNATRPVERQVVRFDVELGTTLDGTRQGAISPDGSRIAFVGEDKDGNASLLTRRLDQADATVLDGTLGHINQRNPFFSPDSKWIGYAADRKLKKISVDGGLPVVIADGVTGPAMSSWSDQGLIASTLTFTDLSLVPATGGTPKNISGNNLGSNSLPFFLPGGKSILLSRGRLGVMPIEGGKGKPFTPPILGTQPKYLPIGYILYLDAAQILQASAFDLASMEPRGSPFPLVEGIESFDISATGTLLNRRSRSTRKQTIQWLYESGKTEPIISTPGRYGFPQLSPDGKRLALSIPGDKENHLWIRDLQSGAAEQLTFSPSSTPLWMPGGKYLLFREAKGISVVPADRSSEPRHILDTAGVPESISPDGHTLALGMQEKDTMRDIWLVPLQGEGGTLQAGTPEPLLNTPADELNPVFSPDGKWLAYSSTQNGPFLVYVRSLKNPRALWQVSTEEGYLPQWSPRGGELMFESLEGRRGLRTASYSVSGDIFVPGPVRRFGGNLTPLISGSSRVYSYPPQGDRVAAVMAADEVAGTQSRPNYAVVLNFFEEIKRHSAQATK